MKQLSTAYRPNDYEAACAIVVARIRGERNSGQEQSPGGRKTPEAQRLIDYCACLSEIAVSRFLNLAWTGCGRDEDGGASYDVGGFLQVRSISNPTYGLITRPKDDPDDITALVHVANTRVCTLLGGARNADIRARGAYRDADTDYPYWTLPQNHLVPLEELLSSIGKERKDND